MAPKSTEKHPKSKFSTVVRTVKSGEVSVLFGSILDDLFHFTLPTSAVYHAVKVASEATRLKLGPAALTEFPPVVVHDVNGVPPFLMV
ncbi:MAG: hypothetical protein WBH45_02630 [Acidobacteriaceae bacterium]